MKKDILFLLPPGFEDNGRREFCPECAELWGVLHYYPAIKETLEIRYVGIQHPRDPICDLLGQGRWNAPTLIVSEPGDHIVGLNHDNGWAHLNSARAIAKYFSTRFGIAVPRGS